MALNSDKFPATRVLAWAFIIAIIAVAFPVAFNILFASKDEVSYDSGVLSSTCSATLQTDPPAPENCVTTFEITLGNTGTNPQPFIEIVMQGAPALWRFDSSVVDIVASAQRRESPVIDYDSTEGQTIIRIEQLQPNRLVVLRISYLGTEAAGQMASMTLAVNATGTLIQTSPHTTVVSRFFRNLIGLF